MLMEAVVNGHRARLVVDTGAGYSVLEAGRARSLGVSPVEANSPFGQFTNLNGESYRVGYINSLRAGAMDFMEKPDVVDRDRSLVGKGFDKCDLFIRERPHPLQVIDHHDSEQVITL